MSSVTTDERITSIERIDQASSVLIDYHSLRAFDLEAFESTLKASTIAVRDLVIYPWGPWLSHIIQALVLHETLLVDSILLEVSQTAARAQKIFPEALRGLFIRRPMRQRVAERVEVSARVFDPLPDFPSPLWNQWTLLDSSEKLLFDDVHGRSPRLIPPEYASDEETVQELDG